MRTRIVAALAALSMSSAPGLSLAAGSQPCAWVSLLDGRDFPGCGGNATPCSTVQYAHDYVIRADGLILVADVGHFGEPSIITAFSILSGEAARLGGVGRPFEVGAGGGCDP